MTISQKLSFEPGALYRIRCNTEAIAPNERTWDWNTQRIIDRHSVVMYLRKLERSDSSWRFFGDLFERGECVVALCNNEVLTFHQNALEQNKVSK